MGHSGRRSTSYSQIFEADLKDEDITPIESGLKFKVVSLGFKPPNPNPNPIPNPNRNVNPNPQPHPHSARTSLSLNLGSSEHDRWQTLQGLRGAV